MILIYVLAAAVVIGWLRGGKLKNYLDDPLDGLMLPVAAFAL